MKKYPIVIDWPPEMPLEALAVKGITSPITGSTRVVYETKSELKNAVHTVALVKEAIAFGGIVSGMVD